MTSHVCTMCACVCLLSVSSSAGVIHVYAIMISVVDLIVSLETTCLWFSLPGALSVTLAISVLACQYLSVRSCVVSISPD